MMIRPTTLLSHRASFATNVAAINPAPSTAITPEGLQGLHNFPETAADAANGSIYCRTLVDGNKVLRVLLFQYQEEQIPLQELEAICKSGFAASGESA